MPEEKKRQGVDGREQAIDGFWSDLELVPPSPKRKRSSFSPDTGTVTVALGSPPGSGKAAAEEGEGFPIPPRPSTFAEVSKNADARRSTENAASAARTSALAAAGVRVKPDSERLARARAIIGDRLASLPEQTGEDGPASAAPPEPIEYCPEHSLIKNVKISPWPSSYSFYERFRSDAEKMLRAEPEAETPDGEGPEYVHFFSYMPQYRQMNSAQLSYYLYWRKKLREGETVRTDMSYVLLCLYEIINLPDLIPAEEGVTLMCRLWNGYGEAIPRLGKYIAQWLCDYCLINRIPAPLDRLEGAAGSTLSDPSMRDFREFYIRCQPHGGEESELPDSGDICRVLSSYDWRDSKFITAENRHLFEKHMDPSLRAAFSSASEENGGNGTDGRKKFRFSSESFPLVTRTRDAFSGALCSCAVKRRIDCTCLSISGAYELRPIVTDAVKFAENQLRACLGIKSRFSIRALPDELKKPITDYFAPLRAESRRRLRAEAEAQRALDVPEYEKLYEAESTGIAPERAREIENRSWSVTDRLVSAFADGEEISPEEAGPGIDVPEKRKEKETEKPESTEHTVSEPPEEDGAGDITSLARRGAEALLDGRGLAGTAKAAGMLPDTLAELINDNFYSAVGDVCVESDGAGGYRIIGYYEEEVRRAIGRQGNQ